MIPSDSELRVVGYLIPATEASATSILDGAVTSTP